MLVIFNFYFKVILKLKWMKDVILRLLLKLNNYVACSVFNIVQKTSSFILCFLIMIYIIFSFYLYELYSSIFKLIF